MMVRRPVEDKIISSSVDWKFEKVVSTYFLKTTTTNTPPPQTTSPSSTKFSWACQANANRPVPLDPRMCFFLCVCVCTRAPACARAALLLRQLTAKSQLPVIYPDFPLDLTKFFPGQHLICFLANKMQDFWNFVLLDFDAEQVYLKLQVTNVRNKEVTANPKRQTLKKTRFFEN